MSSEATTNGRPRFEDKVIQCKICGQEFIWNSGEQEFYKDRSLSEPRRCPDCRHPRGSSSGGAE